MTAQLIDGVSLSRQLRHALSSRVTELKAQGRQPGLAVLLVGDDPASAVYVRNKVKACEEVGLRSLLERFDGSTPEAVLLARIDDLNRDPSIHGILVQLPLPPHIDPMRVIESISPRKDVDGFAAQSAGQLMIGLPGLRACTPWGCMKLIESTGQPIRGKHAVVIGRSNIVGKPMAMMLLQAHATVTLCHSATPDLGTFTRQAAIVVAAVGQRNLVRGDMLKPGAIVIDVGMNRNDDGKLCGDVDFESARSVAGWITPVPGGVGPMTITMLLSNTVDAALAH